MRLPTAAGVVGLDVDGDGTGRRASRAAWSSRFVVPVDFETPERAEHTRAIRTGCDVVGSRKDLPYGEQTISSDDSGCG